MHPADKNHTNLAIKKVSTVLLSTAAPHTTEHKGVSTCSTRMHSSCVRSTYAQNPSFEVVQQQSGKVYLHTCEAGMFSRTLNA